MAANDLVVGANLCNQFLIDAVAQEICLRLDGSTIVSAANGTLSAPSGALSYDAATTMLSYDNGAGGTTNIDLAALAADIYITGGSFDAASSVLTLVDADGGTPDVTIDLSALLGVSTDANNLLTDGADRKPFLDCDAVKDNCTNVCTDVFGNPLFNAFAP